MPQPVLVLSGATASGKTALGVALAKALGGEILSADSMQIYRGMPIATATPNAEERQGVPHHLMEFLDNDTPYSVADWVAAARACIREIAERGRLPMVVGGTGLYIGALCENIRFETFPGSGAVRERLLEEWETLGPEALHQRLLERDPVLGEAVHKNHKTRLIRALEMIECTGRPMSALQQEAKGSQSPYSLCMLMLDFRDRETLYRRINGRVESMLEQGLLEEARAFYRGNPSATAAAAIGYKELLPYLQGGCTLEAATEHLKQQTRRYAKRQLTWMRRETRYKTLYVEDFADQGQLLSAAVEAVHQSGILQKI